VNQAFHGVNTKNEAQVRTATQSLLDQAQSGTLTAKSLGISHDESIKFLGDSADYLDSFNKGLQDATKNLSNVPDLATLQEQEFRARSAFGTGEGPNDGSKLPVLIGGTGLRGADINPAIPAPGISESRVALDGDKVADPISGALQKLGGGSTLKDLLEALQPKSASASSAAAPGGRHFNQYGAVTVIVQGANKDPAELAKLVKAEFIRETLAETGKEDL
jgi:hypothetical protein